MPASSDTELGDRLEALGREFGQREAEHEAGLERARASAEALRDQVCAALAHFHSAAAAAGAPHLRIEVSAVRVDDKHLRAVEFDLLRGRHKAIVVVKARGDVTLVGPFHVGKDEGPCRSFPLAATQELNAGLGDFLESFAQEAATP
jgi:hypothetical protein